MAEVWHLSQALCRGFDWDRRAQLKMYSQLVTVTTCTAAVAGKPSRDALITEQYSNINTFFIVKNMAGFKHGGIKPSSLS